MLKFECIQVHIGSQNAKNKRSAQKSTLFPRLNSLISGIYVTKVTEPQSERPELCRLNLIVLMRN